jgi:PKD repeat protein
MKNYVAYLLALVFVTPTLLAASYPMPGKDTQPAVICTGCEGSNFDGQPNAGKPTQPYSSPIVKHVGRMVDSSSTKNVQNVGIRTIRADMIRVAPTQRGTAPPRVYVKLGGGAVGAYSLNTFFTSTLPSGPKWVDAWRNVGGSRTSYGVPNELVLIPDGFMYAEDYGGGAWTTPLSDKQDILHDFDFDDRGYLYGAYTVFGWGLAQDGGQTGGQLFSPAGQVLEGTTNVTAFKVGGSYYALTADNTGDVQEHSIYDTTNPSSITRHALRKTFGVHRARRNDVKGHIVIVEKATYKLRIYDYATFLAGGAPLYTANPTGGNRFEELAIDDNGTVWAVDESNAYNAKIHRFTPNAAGTTYTQQSYEAGEAFSGIVITASAGYVAVAGDVTLGKDVLLFKVEGNSLRKIDLKQFFLRYYHHALPNFANPPSRPASYTSTPRGIQLVKYNGKLYLMYHAGGMGDVYELEAGDTIGASMRTNGFGTANPFSKGTDAGPYPGDVIRFVATSSNPSIPYTVSWDFGNAESGLNTAQTTTGNETSHQFGGYTTAGQVTAPKKVRAVVATDSTLTDEITVNLKLPTPRIGLVGFNTVITGASSPPVDLLLGDAFIDASDGTVESHMTTWTIDGVATNKMPNQSINTGATLGAHTVTMTGNYGRYNASTLQPTAATYPATVASVPYVIRPFLHTISAAKSGTNAVFSGTGRVTAVSGILSTQTWSAIWILMRGTQIVQTETTSVPIGTVPNFTVAAATVQSGDVVSFTAQVPAANLVGPAEFASYAQSMVLEKPVPSITKTGCANANAPCTLTASGTGLTGATVTWTLTGPATITGTGNPFVPTLTVPGTYSVTVTAVKGIFDGTATTSMPIAGALCGPLPTAEQVVIRTTCPSGTGCVPGASIRFNADVFGYTRQDCDTYTWRFGDNASGSGSSATHSYANAGTYTVRLTISNTSGQTPTELSAFLTISTSGGGGGGEDPPPTQNCPRPTNITINYAGNKGCGPGVICKTGERITFSASKSGDPLTSCDSVSWSFGDNTTSTSKNASKTYNSAGTYTVTVNVSSSGGSASPASVNIPVVPDASAGCNAGISTDNLTLDYKGPASNCSIVNGDVCQRGESIQFDVKAFGYSFQSCDRFEWNFGDGSSATTKNPTHIFSGPAPAYRVSVRIYNTANPTGVTLTSDVPFDSAPLLQTPTISVSGPSTTGKGAVVTFTATSSLNATGWSWSFGDGSARNNSQAGVKSNTSTITHTFTKTGTFTVSVTAKNADDTTERSTGTGILTNVTVTETPVYRFLVPAAIHDNGQNGSLWRTDVQVYYSSPTPSTDPLRMTASFNGKDSELEIRQATFIYEDFISKLTTGNASGSVILTTQSKYKPQIWTRTYNVDPSGKTFGQFIPAIELTGPTGSAIEGSADPVKYYLSGLRANNRYRTNVGFINTSSGEIIADVVAYDDLQNPIKRFPVTLPQYQLQQISLAGTLGSSLPNRPISLEISIPAGKALVAYASFIDGASNDPVYISATAATELQSADYATSINPGVGHIGAWRSDVTIFNPDERGSVTFDLEYYDADGLRRGAARNITLGPLQSKNYEDLLRVTELFPTAPADGVGMLKLETIGTPARYPLLFSRTYNDKGSGGTFGQGIPGFAANRANVIAGKSAIIPGVRSNANYKTNIGLTNASTTPVTVRVQLLDPNSGAVASEQSYTLVGDASTVGTYPFGNLTTGTLKVEIVNGAGPVWAFASVIDLQSEDPEYVPAVPIP